MLANIGDPLLRRLQSCAKLCRQALLGLAVPAHRKETLLNQVSMRLHLLGDALLNGLECLGCIALAA